MIREIQCQIMDGVCCLGREIRSENLPGPPLVGRQGNDVTVALPREQTPWWHCVRLRFNIASGGDIWLLNTDKERWHR